MYLSVTFLSLFVFQQCSPDLRQTRDNGFVPEAQLQFVSDAVMAFAVALRVSRVPPIPQKYILPFAVAPRVSKVPSIPQK